MHAMNHGSEFLKDTLIKNIKFQIGQVVRHRVYDFRGVIFDVDSEYNNTEEWYQSIPETVRPHKEQPFYHLLAENRDTQYIAYVSEQNLQNDDSGLPVSHPRVDDLFEKTENGHYTVRYNRSH